MGAISETTVLASNVLRASIRTWHNVKKHFSKLNKYEYWTDGKWYEKKIILANNQVKIATVNEKEKSIEKKYRDWVR